VDAATAALSIDEQADADAVFAQSVMSGGPTSSGAILWTRLASDAAANGSDLALRVATDPEFAMELTANGIRAWVEHLPMRVEYDPEAEHLQDQLQLWRQVEFGDLVTSRSPTSGCSATARRATTAIASRARTKKPRTGRYSATNRSSGGKSGRQTLARSGRRG
jgi:hypothetical protein